MVIVLPAESTRSNRPLMPFLPDASYVRISLFGGGPGSYFDLARFIFHLPTVGSVCANSRDGAIRTSARARPRKPRVIRMVSSSSEFGFPRRDWVVVARV